MEHLQFVVIINDVVAVVVVVVVVFIVVVVVVVVVNVAINVDVFDETKHFSFYCFQLFPTFRLPYKINFFEPNLFWVFLPR